ncbi:OLC1v1024531C1 [Oldenlandia corymbosa var. corymbosa]|uniref:OLC1v1024531C1 n=1 Tax=Oldenlandia corymbosa var. corymbosa TaxID=529605 RepID=A0AAV1C615_OLDCO|nr:OLC1v1024531C1 [Oldenlandia corymbosa var. corymbosa]
MDQQHRKKTHEEYQHQQGKCNRNWCMECHREVSLFFECLDPVDELKMFVDAYLANEEWKIVLYDVIAQHEEFVQMRQLVIIRKFEGQSAALDFEHVVD